MGLLKEDLKKFKEKIINTHYKWHVFIQTINNPNKFDQHTILINHAFKSVNIADTLISDQPDYITLSKNMGVVEYLEQWQFLDRSIDRIINCHQRGRDEL